ncbi:ABC transporter ATP-binding protein [Neisseria gonorrhoeae]|uniref:ABC transporter ATP-binding protein n=1 Tax=Neisseria gonorrhoeae TaxID=485 RepID=A0A378VVQ5_NEIGO|nr:ABC transporter ATP-binding protein [Neisseria gonorrhoeae]
MDNPDEGEIVALAAKVGLTAGDLNKYPTELSGGMANGWRFCACCCAAAT